MQKGGTKSHFTSWIHDHSVQADSITKKFPDNCALSIAPLSTYEEMWLMIYGLPIYSFFIWIPLIIGLTFKYLEFSMACFVLIAQWTVLHMFPSNRYFKLF